MRNQGLIALAALAALAATPVSAAAEADSWEGLVEVDAKRLDTAYLLPGADFRPYRKLLLDPVEVAFQKDWVENYNRRASTLSQRLTDEDVERIRRTTRQAFTEVFTEAYRKAGFEFVNAPGPDVLRIRAGIVDLDINAPDRISSARSRTYTMESGEATLFLEARDSTTGALLGRALDERETRNTGRVQLSNEVTNLADLRTLFRRWADISVKAFRELQDLSPVPADLQAGQKLDRGSDPPGPASN